LGAGRRTEQSESRSNQGKPRWSGEKDDCLEGEQLVAEFGEYQIFLGREGYELVKRGSPIGRFAEASLESSRVMFKLSRGMLLEVTEKGTREIFSKEKAGLHGFTASDGGMYRGTHEIKITSESPELVDLYAQYFKAVYGLEMHYRPELRRDRGKEYPRVRISNRIAFYDLKNYGAKTGPYTWEVPRQRLDREGAREWLKCFFSGDGEVKKSGGRGYAIVYDSTHRSGLEEIQRLLLDEFGIRSDLQAERDRTKERRHKRPESVLKIVREDNIKFAKEIGSYKKEHIERLDEILRGEGK
jgi:hypothetical protein